jgi:hypothetical protein
MHIIASDSCNTLVDLNLNVKHTNGLKFVHATSFTSLYDNHCFDNLEETSLYLPNGSGDKLYLPRNGSSSCSLDEYLRSIPCIASRSEDIASPILKIHFMGRSDSIDELDEHGSCYEDENGNCQQDHKDAVFIEGVSAPASSSLPVLPDLQDADSDVEADADVIWLTVMQGEVAHATPSQAGIVASTDATTCHIVALRSIASSSSEPLVSLTHVDKVGYTQCLEDMVAYHMTHHHVVSDVMCENYWDESPNDNQATARQGFLPILQQQQHDSMASLAFSDVSYDQEQDECPFPLVEMELHLLGGFLDNDGTSQELSTHLVTTFNDLATKFSATLRITIGTALISCMNNGTCLSNLNRDEFVPAPIGRGLGIHTRTGKVFAISLLNDIAPSHQGPAQVLRSARMFTDCPNAKDTLSVVHTPASQEQENSSVSVLKIQPFGYKSLPATTTEAILKLSNETLLQCTSTSPECEDAHKFCTSLQNTLQFLEEQSCEQVFGGPRMKKPVTFTRDPKTKQWVPASCVSTPTLLLQLDSHELTQDAPPPGTS